MIVRSTDRVLVQGITGRQGAFWTKKMQDYGTRIVGGVSPNRAGEHLCGVPIFGSAREAAQTVDFDVAVMFIPPSSALDAALDAIEAGTRLLVVLTEHIPAHDVMRMHAAAAACATRIVGPNTAGLVTPGETFVGFMPAFNEGVFRPGTIGVVSRSGSLGTLVCLSLVSGGLGQSAFIGIGGDPMIGTTTRDALEALERDPRTHAIALVGEIGGTMEEEAAAFARTMSKPVAAFIAGAASPAGRKMGHAGAIVMGNRGSYASKRRALEAAGVAMAETPSAICELLGRRSGR